MVFNILASNDDDHLRNHGFVWDPRAGGWRLSPLYDVVPRPAIAQERFLHLEVGLQGKLATLDNAMSNYAQFDLQRPEAIALMARVVTTVAGWRERFEAHGAPGRLMDQLARAFRVLDEVASPALRSELAAADDNPAH